MEMAIKTEFQEFNLATELPPSKYFMENSNVEEIKSYCHS